jgi:DNA polymerase III subunit beta
MKIIADKDILLKSFIIVDSVISSKNSNSILSNCLLTLSKNLLYIIGTDNDIAIRHRLDVISDDNVSLLLNGKKVIQILKELPKGEVIFEIDESYSVTIKSKEIKGIFKVIGSEKNDYPDIQNINEKKCISIDQIVLKDLFRKVSYAAATDTIKPSFHGVFIISEKENNITVVASDSRRLSLCSRHMDESINLKEGVIIPLKTVNELNKIFSNGKCLFLITGNQCFFKIGDTEVISRIVDGQFPNYKQVIPIDFNIRAYIKTASLIESLKRILVFTKEPSYKCIMNFSKNKLSIESKTAELGEASESLDIESQSEEKITIGINTQYLIDSLKEVDFESVFIGITGSMSPLCIRPENDENNTAVIMPIQIKPNESI